MPPKKGYRWKPETLEKRSASMARIRKEGHTRVRVCKWCKKEYLGPVMGRHEICSDSCRELLWRDYHLRKHFGISLAEYEKILFFQAGKCAICKNQPDDDSNRLAVDHCHETKKIRGLLCMRCNRAIGLFKDDISLLRSSVEYLERT